MAIEQCTHCTRRAIRDLLGQVHEVDSSGVSPPSLVRLARLVLIPALPADGIPHDLGEVDGGAINALLLSAVRAQAARCAESAAVLSARCAGQAAAATLCHSRWERAATLMDGLVAIWRRAERLLLAAPRYGINH
jgi:hypothetical protein